VVRPSRPKFDSHESVRSTGQRIPIGWFVFGLFDPCLRFLAMTASSIPRSARLPCDLGVVVALEMDGLDVGEGPRPAGLSRVASSRIESLRCAPSTVPPIGIPAWSVRTDHSWPGVE